MMESVKLALTLVFVSLGSLSGAENSNSTWIPVTLGRQVIQPKNELNFTIMPRWTIQPRDFNLMGKEIAEERELREGVTCGRHMLSPGQTVTIQSANFPKKYPRSHKCRWNFSVTSPDSTITISCEVFKLRECWRSYVDISSGGSSDKSRYCNKRDPFEMTSTGNVMEVFFKTTKNRKRRRGFSCTVTASEADTTTSETMSTTMTSSTTPPIVTARPTPPVVTETPTCEPCGTVNRVTRIVGGQETEVNEYPWQVALVVAGRNRVFCGGSLLNDRAVVTAAHCIYNLQRSIEVLLGAHDLDNPSSTQQRIAVSSANYNSAYDPNTLDHDNAILILATPAVLSERVKPVCLPVQSKDYSGYLGWTSGWGTLSEGGSQPTILNDVDVPIISNSQCNSYYSGEISSNMVCAGESTGGKDACQGDSGGPLVTEDDDGRWVLVGITSWGNGCARPYFPGVYNRVSEYVNGLQDYISFGSNNLCSGQTAAPTQAPTAAPTQAPTAAPTQAPTAAPTQAPTAAPTQAPTAAPTQAPTAAPTQAPTSGCRCGQRNPVNKIVGGSPATQHEYPWQVALTSRTSNQPFCGGSIVSDEWIVTAAHCVDGTSASRIRVVIGEHNWQSSTESTVHERLTVSQIIVHPNYNDNTQDNDIALLKLSSAITFPNDNKVAPVCLPTTQNDYSYVDAIITGWGTTSSGGSQPNILYEVTVPTMTNSQCQNSYGNYITSNMICAGLSAGGKDSCQGDSGGPMVTANGNFYELIGVVSWGFGCADPGYPGVYARVTNYLSFINGYISGSTTCPSP